MKIYTSRLTDITLEFKLEDLWVGAFWKRQNVQITDHTICHNTDIWICIIPCFPLHIRKVIPEHV